MNHWLVEGHDRCGHCMEDWPCDGHLGEVQAAEHMNRSFEIPDIQPDSLAVANEDRCTCCGNWTQKGRDKMVLRAREHPIYKTNLSRPCSELTNEIRDKLTEFRGNFSDIRRAYPVWEQLESVEGLLTCAISYLYGTVNDMRKNEAKHG